MIQAGSEVGFDVSNKDDELSNFLSNHNDRIQFLSPSVPSKFSYRGYTIRECDTFVLWSMCRSVICAATDEKYKNKL